MKPLISVVIEAYNEENNALAPHQETLDALLGQEFPLEQVELVLIGSARQIAEWERQHPAWPPLAGVKFVIAEAGESHYWQLKNRGAQAASADLLAFIDSDGLPASRWLRTVVEGLTHGADVVVGPSLYRNGRWQPDSAPMLAAALPSWAFVLAYDSLPGAPRAASLLGHNVAMRRELFLKHSFPTAAHSFPSSLLYFALARAGARIVSSPNSG